jgi:hypothetical protein
MNPAMGATVISFAIKIQSKLQKSFFFGEGNGVVDFNLF